MIKRCTFSVIMTICSQVYADPKPSNETIQINSNQKGLESIERNNVILRDQSFLNSVFPSMEDIAKKACGYKKRPQSITVSVGIIFCYLGKLKNYV